MTAPLRLLMTVQALDRDDPLVGFAHTWAAKLAARVQKLYVVALRVGAYNLPANVEVFSLGKERGRGKLGKFLAFHRIVAPLAIRRKFDGVFVHQTQINAILAAPYAKVLRIPLIMFHGHSGSKGPTLRMANALIDRALTSTPAGYAIDTPKKVVTGQGIDVDVFKPASAESVPAPPKSIVSVGRLSPIKKYDVQIEAIDILVNHRNRRDFTLHIYGPPDPASYADRLAGVVNDRGLESVIRFEGPTEFSKMPAVYQGAYAVVHTCDTESLDKAVLEAMACARPAITSIQSYRTVMDSHADLLICRPNDPTDLANKMQAVLDMPNEQYASLGAALRQTVVRDHSADRLAEQVIAIIQDLRRRGRQPRTSFRQPS